MRFVRSNLLLVAVIALFAVDDVRGQQPIHVRVHTNYPQAVLYADALLIGAVSDRLVAIPAGTSSLRLVPPGGNTWSIAPVASVLDASEGDTVVVRLDFPFHYRVESMPFGADVLVEEAQRLRPIGETPLLYRSEQPLGRQIVIRRDGYAVERVQPGKEIWNRHVVDLSPSHVADPTAAQVDWVPPSRHRAWIDYVALGSALVAGGLAVHYKFRADDLYAEFEASGDPRLRTRIDRFDTRAGVAFGAMQAGLGVFAVRLVLR